MQTACRKAVGEFLDSDQPCGFVDEKSGSSCVNTKIGHAKGHQGASGIFLTDGSFVDGGFDAPRFLTSIESSIKSIIESIAGMGHAAATARLIQQHRELLQEVPRSSETEKLEKPSALAKPAVAPHVDKSSTLDCSCSLCIFGRPEYELPCGHPICEFCLADFSEKGKAELEHVAVHQQCMYGPRLFEAPYKAPVRPQFSGIRMLSLDGGGVRGIIQLVTLRRIENLIGLDLPIGQFFDLIVGTGTGGMIALGLAKEGDNAAQCTKAFEQILKDSFYRSFIYRGWSYAWSFFRYISPRYSSTAMENALRNAFKPRKLFGLGDTSRPCSSSVPRVAVTTTVGGNSWLAANYNRGDNKRYLSSAISTHEAARATSATPLYLDPFISPADKSTCYDGGLAGANTSALALTESKEIWGPDAKLDLLLSLGPGIGATPAPVPDWFPTTSEHLVSSVTDMLESLNGEAAWDRFATTANSAVRQRVRRLNPVFEDWETEPAFDEVNSMKQLAQDAGEVHFNFPTMDAAPPAFATPYEDALLATADQLRASLFYFHITRVVLADARGSVVCEGAVRCRLALPEQKEGFSKLMAMTKALVLVDSNGERKIEIGEVVEGETAWEMPVSLTGTLGRRTGPIRVDALFEGERQVAISGFPVTVEELRRQYSDWE
ncbi:acyl transferase/acyl hydrolase/lysophospholipase [Lasiosphaeria hispida]|uniref:Acyl transferase/acyl hydrolase/lysophospholipase n=1 Tax=Lasiosphaeria hispida TaxID=260671 RepID=A0AAJ0HP32_9PEZI|nr:acyl transferase/acyl hydrolase/lysophospholipase [Lasiosphaeria hispida]